MFTKAQIKLTILYSFFFLSLFWVFSFGLYEWMNASFGEGYISQVEHRQGGSVVDEDAIKPGNSNAHIVTVAGDVALDQLFRNLIALNGILVFVVPAISWYVARRTLTPVQKIHEQQKQFVSDASHELRTPLSIMSGEMEVILKKDRNASDYKKTIISTKEELDRLNSLVENLLFLAREDQGKKSLQLETVDITDVVNSAIAVLHSKAKSKHILVNFEPPQDSISLKGSEALLKQLFVNLIDNAIKYTLEKRTVTISIKKKNDSVEVVIKDTGVGVSEEDKERIFDRFYRADTSRSQTKGYGLGLAISRAIVERHHGTLTLSSQVGKGSTFRVMLPYSG